MYQMVFHTFSNALLCMYSFNLIEQYHILISQRGRLCYTIEKIVHVVNVKIIDILFRIEQLFSIHQT